MNFYTIQKDTFTFRCEDIVEDYSCRYCPCKTPLRTTLIKHVREKHSNLPTTSYNIIGYACKNCNFLSHSLLILLQHKTNCTARKLRKEEIRKNIQRLSTIKKNKSTFKVRIKWYACPHCRYTTRMRYKLTRHINTKHNNTCSVRKHGTNKRHLDVGYQCSKCTFSTMYLNRLYQHISTEHIGPRRVVYECQLCPYKTNSIHNVKHHHSDPEKLSSFECGYCSYKSEYMGAFVTHMREFHKDSETGLDYKCSYCAYKTIYQSQLEIHLFSLHTVAQYSTVAKV